MQDSNCIETQKLAVTHYGSSKPLFCAVKPLKHLKLLPHRLLSDLQLGLSKYAKTVRRFLLAV